MNLENKNNYISGICKMSSFNLGPSYMDAFCLNKDSYLSELGSMFDFKEKDVILNEVNESFDELMKELLNLPDKALNTFLYLIKQSVGEVKRIYTSDSDILWEALSSVNNNKGVFYFLEEVYFVEFEDCVISFMIGNFE